jgi:hypothetical protein
VAVEAGNARLVEQIVTNLEAMRRADVAEMYHRDTHESCAHHLAEAHPDGS